MNARRYNAAHRNIKHARNIVSIQTRFTSWFFAVTSRHQYYYASLTESILRAAARLIYGARRPDHVTVIPLLRQFLWLSVPGHVQCVVDTVGFTVSGLYPPIRRGWLDWSAETTFCVHDGRDGRCYTLIDAWRPYVSCCCLCNALPSDVTSMPSLSSFRRRCFSPVLTSREVFHRCTRRQRSELTMFHGLDDDAVDDDNVLVTRA